VEEPTITKSKKGKAGPEINKEHAHCFFRREGTVHGEFVPPNTTVNSDFYCDILRHLRENVQQKRPEVWCNHNWLLQKTHTHMRARACMHAHTHIFRSKMDRGQRTAVLQNAEMYCRTVKKITYLM
jgi:hypothetical protein